MSASIDIHEITLTDGIAAGAQTDWPLTVKLPNGYQIVIWPSGGEIGVRIPAYEGSTRHFSEITIELPKPEDLSDDCDKTDNTGNFHIIATHRH